MLDFRDLLAVKAVCDTGSFRKAAKELGVTQPTLSNRVAQLEVVLMGAEGIGLVHRGLRCGD